MASPIQERTGMQLRYILPALAALVLSAGSSASADDQYRLVFDASVTAIEGDLGQFNLPFSLLLGDTVTGEIDFNSEAALQAILHSSVPGTSIGGLRLQIGETSIVSAFNSGSVNQPPSTSTGQLPGQSQRSL